MRDPEVFDVLEKTTPRYIATLTGEDGVTMIPGSTLMTLTLTLYVKSGTGVGCGVGSVVTAVEDGRSSVRAMSWFGSGAVTEIRSYPTPGTETGDAPTGVSS